MNRPSMDVYIILLTKISFSKMKKMVLLILITGLRRKRRKEIKFIGFKYSFPRFWKEI